MKKIVASGPVIIQKGKLLATMNDGDNFYKIPGGKLEEGESLEECAIRELKEETGFSCELLKKIHTMKLKKNPDNDKTINVELYHFIAKLKNSVKNYNSFNYNNHIVSWLDIDEIKKGKYFIAPNIKFLIDKKDII
jgi:8-oxo-dGTP pyrophosphatase MutT (NUDIX family)